MRKIRRANSPQAPWLLKTARGTWREDKSNPDRKDSAMSKYTAGLGIVAAVAVVFYLTSVPAWAWALPIVLFVVNVAMIVRARSIEARR